jgi:hypothetical protein
MSRTSTRRPSVAAATSRTRAPCGAAGRPEASGSRVGVAIERAFELPDGYTLQIGGRPDTLAAFMQYLVREGIRRLPRVAVTVDSEGGSSWVRISGSPEVKTFLEQRLLGGGVVDARP